MGTGKTKIALDNACILYNQGKIDRLLVIAPKGTYMNWVESGNTYTCSGLCGKRSLGVEAIKQREI